MDMQNITSHFKRNLLNFSHYHKVELAVLYPNGFGCPSLPDYYIMLITFLKDEDGIVHENYIHQSPPPIFQLHIDFSGY